MDIATKAMQPFAENGQPGMPGKAGKPMACSIATKPNATLSTGHEHYKQAQPGMLAQNDSDNKANTPQFTTNRRNS